MPWNAFPRTSKRRLANALGYTQPEVAEALGIGLRTVQRAVRRGELRATRVGPSMVRIPFDAVTEWLGKGVDPDGKLRQRAFRSGPRPKKTT